MSDLKVRILKNAHAEFTRATIEDAEDPGIEPFGTHVLILMDLCAETSSGGVLLPPEKIAQMNMGSESGVVVDIGEAAFRYYDDGSKWEGRKPAVGERVFIERYAGRELLGRDGKTYRLMTYSCVGGREMPPKVEKAKEGKTHVRKSGNHRVVAPPSRAGGRADARGTGRAGI